MDNCLKSKSSSKIAGDDEEWSSPESEGSNNGVEGINNGKRREVKIKITKKQLEGLLGEVDTKKLRVEQVLAQLLKQNNNGYQRPWTWRPALQSIPEVN